LNSNYNEECDEEVAQYQLVHFCSNHVLPTLREKEELKRVNLFVGERSFWPYTSKKLLPRENVFTGSSDLSARDRIDKSAQWSPSRHF